MKTIQMTVHIGPDGDLDLHVPTGLPDSEAEVLVVLQPVKGVHNGPPEELGWPPRFFERTSGGWQGAPLARGKQGECEDRDKLQ